MMTENEKLLKAFIDCLATVQEAIEQLENRIFAIALKNWETLKAPKPINPEDRAFKWLEHKLAEIKNKHRELEYYFKRDSDGRIVSLKFKSPNSEVREDVLTPAKWAFKVASERPMSPQGTARSLPDSKPLEEMEKRLKALREAGKHAF